MRAYQAVLAPQSAFATPLKGDTLFGQLCWAIRNRFGEDGLAQLLSGYTRDQPFAVVSDAFPEGYLPLPKLPGIFYTLPENLDRKAIKKRNWLAQDQSQTPLTEWLGLAVSNSDLAAKLNAHAANAKRKFANNLSETHPQPRNSINRLTNTTGANGFAPYKEWFLPGLRWFVYVLLDDSRINADDVKQCLQDIGAIGYGKDASIGMGKFEIASFQPHELPKQQAANACLTLAPCAPQGQSYDSQHSYYQLFTRFGRHGDTAVHQEGKPFKNPVLLAQTAAVFSTTPQAKGFIGQGIGGKASNGDGLLSKTLPNTVHQGYAPVLAIHIKNREA